MIFIGDYFALGLVIVLCIFFFDSKTSIRYMAMRRGVDDVRYLKLLKKYSGKPGVDELLKNAAKRVEDAAFDATVPDKIRSEVVELLKKYHR